jgi:hypothetical protein
MRGRQIGERTKQRTKKRALHGPRVARGVVSLHAKDWLRVRAVHDTVLLLASNGHDLTGDDSARLIASAIRKVNGLTLGLDREKRRVAQDVRRLAKSPNVLNKIEFLDRSKGLAEVLVIEA